MRNINIIALVIILFCSCPSSGKLTDSKFPFALHFKGFLPNKYPLPIDPTTGAQILGTYYSQTDLTPTPPMNVGSYTIHHNFIDWGAVDKEQSRYTVITVSIILGIVIISMLIAFGTKDKNSDNDGTFPAIHTSRDIKNIISNYEKSL